jgi:deferrochelatase/peroxidase EfeB
MTTVHSPAPQQGILNRPPDHMLAASFIMTATDATSAGAAIEKLRALVHAELRSELADESPSTPKDAAPPETGELGFSDHYDRYHLTITVGFGLGAYSRLGVAANDQPQDLRDIPWALLQDTPDLPANGDLVVQICSDSLYICEHVLRRIDHDLGADLQVVWCLSGNQRHTSRSGRVNRNEGRALIGFLDGTANLDPAHNPADHKLVFVDPAAVGTYPPQTPPSDPAQPSPYGGPQPPTFPPDLHAPPVREPDWTIGGSYMVIRGSTINTNKWDTTALGAQEHTIGRWKYSGGALDQPDDDSIPIAEPNFANDPTGATTPLTAHIRKANPRGPGDADRRIFRRGYPLISATTSGMELGLVFVCFARTITTPFEVIPRAWTTNENCPLPGAGVDALRAFEHVLSGGYFFVPPLEHSTQPWSWVLPTT